MARKVALSVTAPANVHSRGHRMFVKKAKNASKWTTGDGMEERFFQGSKLLLRFYMVLKYIFRQR